MRKEKDCFVHLLILKKAYDRVPRVVTRWVQRKPGVKEWLVAAIMALYEEAWTVVQWMEAVVGLKSVGIHKVSVLSDVSIELTWELVVLEELNKKLRT